jgi:hypothetical protein
MWKQYFRRLIELLFAGLVLAVLTDITAYGQFRVTPAKTVGNSITCHVGGETFTLTPNQELIKSISFAPNDDETQEIFDNVSRYTELTSNIYTVPVTQKINLLICPGQVNFIAYNGDWVQALYDQTNTPWALYTLIAHEIGHYVKAHDRTSVGSNYQIELEADEYAGSILAKMGSCLSDAEIAYRSKIMEKSHTSDTHPPINQRLEAVKSGWKKFGTLCSNEQPYVFKVSGWLTSGTPDIRKDISYEGSNFAPSFLYQEPLTGFEFEIEVYKNNKLCDSGKVWANAERSPRLSYGYPEWDTTSNCLGTSRERLEIGSWGNRSVVGKEGLFFQVCINPPKTCK